MNDLEERLRADFEAATAEVDYAIDPGEVLRAGRAARRTRTMGRVAAFTAAVVALFGVSVYVAPPLIAQILDHETMEISNHFQWDKTNAEFDQLSVKLQSKNGVVTATATGLRDGAVAASKVWVVPDAHTPMRVGLGSRTAVAIFPGEVQQLEVLGLAGSGGQQQWMRTFGVTVAAFQLETAKADPGSLDWVWVDPAGAVRSFDGAEGAKVTLGGQSCGLFVSRKANRMGLIGHFSFQLSDVSDASMLDGALVWGGPDTVSWQLGLLPAGAHDVQLKLSKPAGEWVAVALSDGSVMVAARVPGEPEQVVTGLSYVRADGSTVKLGH